MLNESSLLGKIFAIAFVILYKINGIQAGVAPILDIDNESLGYIGTIGERNVLVDLKPHLQIKNIDDINGICSYHVFKPTSEDFPFTIDIKDKTTGEAVIELIRKETEQNLNQEKKHFFLDCNKRKHYDFLIQAHDCSTPSLSSKKIPVKIELIDHDDFVLKFEQDSLNKTLIESEEIYENFMSVRAKDNDCTNDGYACSYKLLTNDLNPVDRLFPITIDKTGTLSTIRTVKKGEFFEFIIRAYDCLNNLSFVDAKIIINVIESCVPQWTNYPSQLLTSMEKIRIFENLKTTSCEENNQNLIKQKDTICKIDSIISKVTLNSDESVKKNCQNKCKKIGANNIVQSSEFKTILFSGRPRNAQSDEDDDSIEDYDENTDDENKIISQNGVQPINSELTNNIILKSKEPLNYISFAKENENAQKIDFDGKFGEEFTISAWIRRSKNVDKTLKEQVLCGTDSKSMNRHHFGLYFYRGNFKFLFRKEPNTNKDIIKQGTNNIESGNIDSNEAFYPSLWEWSIYEPLLSDSKWHFYEIKFNYPNVSLFIDGVRFIENNTNSDIIDAYELNDAPDTGPITTYVGACYHARTQVLTDRFEGDIGSIILTKTEKSKDTEKEQLKKCSYNCNDYITLDSKENIDPIVSENLNEIKLKTTTIDEMINQLGKITYTKKELISETESSFIKLETNIHCQNDDKQIKLNEININLKAKIQKEDFKIQLDGEKQIFVSKLDLENGIEPFKDVSFNKILINKQITVNDFNDESSENESDSVKFSSCEIKISPERNMMTPTQNNEKIMFLQNLLDEFGLKFEETLNSVLISGLQSIENYEIFIHRLTYVVININEVEVSMLDLIKNKKFSISCIRADTNTETNSILIQTYLSKNDDTKTINEVKNMIGPVANKQIQKFIVSENDDDIIHTKTKILLGSNKNQSSPLVLAILVMASCSIGFLLVFGAIKMYSSHVISKKRKPLPNEENPQMEWDDSGLNITENPLDSLVTIKEQDFNDQNLVYYDDEYTSSDEEGFIDEDQYSFEEQPEKVIDRELEWDDTSLEIKVKDKQEPKISKNSSNKSTSFIDINKFV